MPCLRSGSWWSVVSALCGRTYHANATSSVPGAIASWAPRPQDQGSPTLQVPQIAWGDRRGRVCFFRPPRHFARNTVGGKQRRAVAPLTTAEITFVGSHARHTPARQLPETPSPELCSLGPLVRERAQESEIFRLPDRGIGGRAGTCTRLKLDSKQGTSQCLSGVAFNKHG